MTTFLDIIELWPSVSDFAADIGIEESHARTIKVRNSISPTHWPKLVEAAAARNIPITHAALAEAYAARHTPAEDARVA